MRRDFFSEHDRFLSTSSVGNWPDRLNARYDAIIERQIGQFAGKRVLDIASHDGRWSFAALNAGASHVTGVEVRDELSAAARNNLESLGFGSDRFEAITGDIFSQNGLAARKFDIVLCLGFLYHTTRHEETIDLIRSTDAPLVIVDTRLAVGSGSFIELRNEPVNNPAHGNADRGVRNGMILNAWPSREAVIRLLGHFGYEVDVVDWHALIRERGIPAVVGSPQSDVNPVGDYASDARGTFVGKL